MHELVDFLSQPLAMELAAAQSFVSSIRNLERQKIELSPICCYSEDGELLGPMADFQAVEQMATKGGKLTAVVPLMGPLSMHGGWFSSSTKAFAETISRLDANEAIATMIYWIDSPGGTVTGTLEAANTVRAIRDAGRTKTISVVEPMMASAATWIGTAAGEVIVTPSGEAGSIGVISMYEDWSAALERMGIKIEIARTPAKKARYSGVESMTDEMRQDMEQRNVAAYSQFVGAMVKNRGHKVASLTASLVESRFGGGEMMTAEDARASGLIDRIGTLQEVLSGIGKPGRPKGGKRAEDPTAKEIEPTDEQKAEEAKADRWRRLEEAELPFSVVDGAERPAKV